jgi:DNA-binding transcriptional LysR family regulator
VCRAVEARLGIGVLPLAAARSFAPAMSLRVVALSDDWAERRMLLVARVAPPAESPLAALTAHLEHCANAG